MSLKIKSSKELTVREKLVANILYYSSDEYETKSDMFELATESNEKLLDRLISVLDYYYESAQEND